MKIAHSHQHNVMKVKYFLRRCVMSRTSQTMIRDENAKTIIRTGALRSTVVNFVYVNPDAHAQQKFEITSFMSSLQTLILTVRFSCT